MNQHIEDAVSPVVGVMLMLVVVIIIAAVVSGFAGGLVHSTKSTPQIALNVHIANSGYYAGSFFKAEVTSVSTPVPSRDLEIVTSWSKTLSNSTTPVKGGATVTPGVTNFNVWFVTEGIQNPAAPPDWQCVCPQGDGPGVGMNGTETSYGEPYEGTGATSMASIGQNGVTNYTWFGNYNLQAGTVMYSQPFGAMYDGSSVQNFTVGYGLGGVKYAYQFGTDSTNGAIFNQTSTDQMQAVLGQNWNVLRPGDIVSVKVIHIPSGRTIWQGQVPVEGSVLQ